MIYSDLIVVVTDIQADESIRQIEKELKLYQKGFLNKKTYLLLLHPENAELSSNTYEWLKHRKVDLHIHLRKNNSNDTKRFCRIILNRAVGLVLGGGGAKGFAHIGAMIALAERGVHIDFIGGSSAGALYACGMSYADFNFNQINEMNAEGVRRKLTKRDWALPLISMMTGKKFKLYLKKLFGQHNLEDLWVNAYCISTNFSQASIKVHKTGVIWKNVHASMAIPGVFPPVIIDENLHVDGGVMDNLPIEPMQNYPVSTIIAISLNSLDIQSLDCKETPTSWELLWEKISGKKQNKIPGLSSILVNSIIINSKQKQKVNMSKVDYYIELDLKGFSMLSDKKWQEIQQKGYEQTKAYFDSLETKI